MTITFSFYQNPDVVTVAKALLGKLLLTKINGQITGGYITETEAYAGVTDRASHAYNNRRTERTEVMYAAGGVAYVYLCYGIHNLLNVVTAAEGTPHAVLIRALEPCVGTEIMLQRRKRMPLATGPGTLTTALGITRAHNGQSFLSSDLWIEEGIKIESIAVGPRIGIDYAGPDALLPYRFVGTLSK
jgi:DNA-3-methyladenine glycosylase